MVARSSQDLRYDDLGSSPRVEDEGHGPTRKDPKQTRPNKSELRGQRLCLAIWGSFSVRQKFHCKFMVRSEMKNNAVIIKKQNIMQSGGAVPVQSVAPITSL